MTKNNILPVDIIHVADNPEFSESECTSELKCDIETGDIDELIFPEEHFYISQR